MITSAEAAELKEVPLFAGLPDEELEQISRFVHRTTVPAGTLLVSAHLPGEAVYSILEGSVKVQLVSEEGLEVTAALLGPGDTLGELGVISPRRTSANVVTRQETVLLWLDRKSFLRCLDFSPGLCRNLVRELGDRLRRANDQIQSLATLDVTGRVARQILELVERYGKPVPGEGIYIPIPVTQGEIAEMVAATRERVNQIMVRLKRGGVLDADPEHRISVRRPEVLADLSRF